MFSSSSNDRTSGAPLADFVFGEAAQVTGTQLLDWALLRELYFGTYAQDDWKISPKHLVEESREQ